MKFDCSQSVALAAGSAQPRILASAGVAEGAIISVGHFLGLWPGLDWTELLSKPIKVHKHLGWRSALAAQLEALVQGDSNAKSVFAAKVAFDSLSLRVHCAQSLGTALHEI